MSQRDSETMLPRRAILALMPGAVFYLWSRRIALGADAPPVDAFLRLSTLLTGFPDVDSGLATRLRAALLDLVPATWQALARLLPIALHAPDDATLMLTARDAGLGDAALALVAAWYTGTVGSGAHTEVVAYADALMYRTVADGLAPPTYALGGPAWWTAAPPPAGVSPPIAEHPPRETRPVRKGKPS